ncbi:GNAT family N-acetyltransferase [soil metagenome]
MAGTLDTGRVMVETDRLVMREFVEGDAESLFRLDSDPEVHRYLGGNPLVHIDQSVAIVARVRQQYRTNGIGRWVTLEKSSGDFLGWSGLRFVPETVNGRVDFIDLGYRFLPAFWGKGYASEAAIASVRHGFDVMKLDAICGYADRDNTASRRVLEKAGLCHTGSFLYDLKPTEWYELARAA